MENEHPLLHEELPVVAVQPLPEVIRVPHLDIGQ